MAKPHDLVSLATVKSWLNIAGSDDKADKALASLISQVSRAVLSYIERPSLLLTVETEMFDGGGTFRFTMPRWPVLAVTSLYVDQQLMPAASALVTTAPQGWRLETFKGPPGSPQALDLFGYAFCRGRSNVVITYAHGYAEIDEAATIPVDPFKVEVAAPYGTWCRDEGVTINGVAATKIVSGTPTTGQYSVSAGVYLFAAADAGKAALISYSYVPLDLEQATMEQVAERYRYQGRIGETSKSLGGQTTTAYQVTDLPPYVKKTLQPYKNVVPR